MSETNFATALDTLGQILPADPGRDAIHLATLAVTAGERLFPGQHIGVRDGDTLQAFATAEKLVGIVDPFLAGGVHPGQMFWLVLYPRTITSLRHVWEHPDFGAEKIAPVSPTIASAAPDKAASEAWLRDWCAAHDSPPYEVMLEAVQTGSASYAEDDYDSGYVRIDTDYVSVSGRDASGEIPAEFWHHFEIVTGKTLSDRPSYFSCSC